jgi:nuclear receptor interaction protein
MTVSEDGTVRQHDLRRPHSCRDSCPDAVFRLPGIDLYSLSMSESAPHTFAVGGQTNVAYICDRRKLSHQTPSWGPHTLRAGQVDCVRRLGLPQEEWAKVRAGRYVSEQHVSCVKISADHPDEVLCAFATHSTALFNLRDTPEDRGARAPGSGVVRPNDARFRGNPNPNPNPEPVPVPVSGPNQTSNSNANATAHPNRRTRADSSSPGQGRGAPKRRLSDGTSRSRSIGQSGNRLSENEGEEGAAPEKTGPERFLRTPIDSDDDQRELRMEVDGE